MTENNNEADILAELGAYIVQRRIDFSWTQSDLAQRAGLSKRTIERLESGHSIQLGSLIRILRELELLAAWKALFSTDTEKPMDLLFNKAKKRKRASRRQNKENSGWTWGDGK